MPINVQTHGRNNEVDASASVLARGEGAIVMHGDNNFVTIQDSNFRVNVHITLGGNGFVQIGRNLDALRLLLHLAADSEMLIGEACSFNGLVRLMSHERASIRIGDRCLFASDVDVTASDMHSIIDVATQKRINPARSVVIGNRVWIGQKSTILKGVSIGDGAIVGASSVVTRDVPANVAAAGNPARVVRTGVTWDFKLL
jgi:acetyltransferase-like isoleucine patch superfamily enzyme